MLVNQQLQKGKCMKYKNTYIVRCIYGENHNIIQCTYTYTGIHVQYNIHYHIQENIRGRKFLHFKSICSKTITVALLLAYTANQQGHD